MGGWAKSVKPISVPQIFQWDFTSLSRHLEPKCICSPGLSHFGWLLGHSIELWAHPPFRLREGLAPSCASTLFSGASLQRWPWLSSSHYTSLLALFFELGTHHPGVPNGPTKGTGTVFGPAKTTAPCALSNCKLHTLGNLNPSMHCPGILRVTSKGSSFSL